MSQLTEDETLREVDPRPEYRPAMNTAATSPNPGPTTRRRLPSCSRWPQSSPRARSSCPVSPISRLRVRKVLSDENVTQDMVVRVVGSEPALAARLMQIGNSAALNFSGKPITELRTAISRMGLNMVRSAAIAFAMSQLKKQDALKGLEKPLEDLWKRSAAVAAMSHAVARRYSKVNPDTALLAGLLHGIGQLYILTRSAQHPGLFANQAAYTAIVRDWHSAIAKALLENWEMAEEVIEAVSNFEDLERSHSGPGGPDGCGDGGQPARRLQRSPGNHRAQHARCRRLQADENRPGQLRATH